MRATDFYRGLLLLYPADFRNQFSGEMISVFEQRAGERFADRNSAPVAFFAIEFLSLLKGAFIMWLAETLTQHRNPSPADASNTPPPPLTVEELTKQRATAIKKMCASIAEHDFNTARQYSYEEARLKNLLRDLMTAS
jgi:hypothetical protein